MSFSRYDEDGALTSHLTHCCIGARCVTHCATGDIKEIVKFLSITTSFILSLFMQWMCNGKNILLSSQLPWSCSHKFAMIFLLDNVAIIKISQRERTFVFKWFIALIMLSTQTQRKQI